MLGETTAPPLIGSHSSIITTSHPGCMPASCTNVLTADTLLQVSASPGTDPPRSRLVSSRDRELLNSILAQEPFYVHSHPPPAAPFTRPPCHIPRTAPARAPPPAPPPPEFTTLSPAPSPGYMHVSYASFPAAGDRTAHSVRHAFAADDLPAPTVNGPKAPYPVQPPDTCLLPLYHTYTHPPAAQIGPWRPSPTADPSFTRFGTHHSAPQAAQHAGQPDPNALPMHPATASPRYLGLTHPDRTGGSGSTQYPGAAVGAVTEHLPAPPAMHVQGFQQAPALHHPLPGPYAGMHAFQEDGRGPLPPPEFLPMRDAPLPRDEFCSPAELTRPLRVVPPDLSLVDIAGAGAEDTPLNEWDDFGAQGFPGCYGTTHQHGH